MATGILIVAALLVIGLTLDGSTAMPAAAAAAADHQATDRSTDTGESPVAEQLANPFIIECGGSGQWCTDDETCCQSQKTQKWSCCPIGGAVCCPEPPPLSRGPTPTQRCCPPDFPVCNLTTGLCDKRWGGGSVRSAGGTSPASVPMIPVRTAHEADGPHKPAEQAASDVRAAA
ncbi:unnamed protein product [Vitrella brassicaformis CCMP3155]|uniref:Granulins domain-containing protein n=2 Tax=Vitrella brassicaformis TaxID=1169539 RepID=A0A0G4GWB6_VITBC|nr:unnamed protein product [Vitrella brassicaformis CCMP3155]|mmetsp:Transcript_13389/g.31961  ORF Transcript_13389/g.31961 Transcript_13389/m.31961 type:complete len:174 (+) Transcript_13389:142-663(+)|eukprot:CEM35303.1 unnamed protein product [Vitrella brassicaformis CCMP3155]